MISDERLQQIRGVGGGIAMLAALILLFRPELGKGSVGTFLFTLILVAGVPAGFATMLVVKPFWERFR